MPVAPVAGALVPAVPVVPEAPDAGAVPPFDPLDPPEPLDPDELLLPDEPRRPPRAPVLMMTVAEEFVPIAEEFEFDRLFAVAAEVDPALELPLPTTAPLAFSVGFDTDELLDPDWFPTVVTFDAFEPAVWAYTAPLQKTTIVVASRSLRTCDLPSDIGA